jgi:hypothetical protein
MYNIGDSVFAFWKASGLYHLGTVVEVGSGQYHIVFEDGDQGAVSENELMRPDLNVGSQVIAMWTDKKFYPGTVQKIVGRALFVHFDDGDRGWTSFAGIAKKN